MSSWWMSDQDGTPSVIVTLVSVSFVATTVAYVLSMVDRIGIVSIRPFDAIAAGAYFGPIIAAFVGCRWIESKRTQ
jgi:hypothetical protein